MIRPNDASKQPAPNTTVLEMDAARHSIAASPCWSLSHAKPTTSAVSQALYARAQKVVPGGIFGHYGYSVRKDGPKFFSRAEGAHFWDVDGNEYIDYMCAYGPMILGYRHPAIEAAVEAEQRHGNTVSLAAPIMVELAETLVGDGGRRGLGAVRQERRRRHTGWPSWWRAPPPAAPRSSRWRAATTAWRLGCARASPAPSRRIWSRCSRCLGTTPTPSNSSSARIPVRSPASSHRPTTIRCSPTTSFRPPGYWKRMEALCRASGIVLIVDDVRSGFRLHPAGSNMAYGFTPDLICFGKAIGNGHPLAALVGTDALKDAAKDVYLHRHPVLQRRAHGGGQGHPG